MNFDEDGQGAYMRNSNLVRNQSEYLTWNFELWWIHFKIFRFLACLTGFEGKGEGEEYATALDLDYNTWEFRYYSFVRDYTNIFRHFSTICAFN